MPVENFLQSQGFGADTAPAPSPERQLTSGRAASQGQYLGLYGASRAADFLRDQSKSGFLSPASTNPMIRQLVESTAQAQLQRTQSLGRAMSAAGVNPAVFEQMISVSEKDTASQLNAQMAGYENARQQREYQALEGFVNLENQIESERTARGEDSRRFDQIRHDVRKQQRKQNQLGYLDTAVSLAGLFAGGAGGFAGSAVGGLVTAGKGIYDFFKGPQNTAGGFGNQFFPEGAYQSPYPPALTPGVAPDSAAGGGGFNFQSYGGPPGVGGGPSRFSSSGGDFGPAGGGGGGPSDLNWLQRMGLMEKPGHQPFFGSRN